MAPEPPAAFFVRLLIEPARSYAFAYLGHLKRGGPAPAPPGKLDEYEAKAIAAILRRLTRG
jgi:hypothetical protein